jgi:hypothetical protein
MNSRMEPQTQLQQPSCDVLLSWFPLVQLREQLYDRMDNQFSGFSRSIRRRFFYFYVQNCPGVELTDDQLTSELTRFQQLEAIDPQTEKIWRFMETRQYPESKKQAAMEVLDYYLIRCNIPADKWLGIDRLLELFFDMLSGKDIRRETEMRQDVDMGIIQMGLYNITLLFREKYSKNGHFNKTAVEEENEPRDDPSS